jgi:hypothetical protein
MGATGLHGKGVEEGERLVCPRGVKPLDPKKGRRHPATVPLSTIVAHYRDNGLV